MIIDLFRLTDKVAIVTGAGRGIGRGIALGFAEAGAHVVCVARSPDQIETTAAKIRGMDRNALAVSADVTDSQQVANMVSKTLQELGRIDVLVNNAGGGVFSSALDLSEERWEQILRLNLTSTFLCCKAVARTMTKQGGGSIINMSSRVGELGVAKHVAYSSAKAGIINLTRALAWEWGTYNIRVNCLVPGPIEHERLKDFFDRWREKQMAPLLIKRYGQPEDVAAAAIYLASDASSFITGQMLRVDGGLRYTYTFDDDVVEAMAASGHA